MNLGESKCYNKLNLINLFELISGSEEHDDSLDMNEQMSLRHMRRATRMKRVVFDSVPFPPLFYPEIDHSESNVEFEDDREELDFVFDDEMEENHNDSRAVDDSSDDEDDRHFYHDNSRRLASQSTSKATASPCPSISAVPESAQPLNSLGQQLKLLEAIDNGNVSVVRHLIEVDHLDPNFEIQMKSPICHATSLGYTKILAILLDAGADPNTPVISDLKWERHPVHIAASKGHMDALQVLISHGADINQPDFDHRTPMHWVAMYGQAHMIKWMLEAGASVNVSQTDGFTPLHTATCLGHKEVCELLLDGGADVTRRDRDGWTPLHTAVCYGYSDIVSLLLDKGANPLTVTSLSQDTSLHIACTKGKLDMVEFLIYKGLPLEKRNVGGFTPLHTAVCNNRVTTTFHLIKCGANVNTLCNKGTSPFYLAAIRCEMRIMKLLLDAGCRVSKEISLSVLQHSRELGAEVERKSCNPQSLMDLCGVIIRQSMAPQLQTNTERLPLPHALKNVIKMDTLAIPSIYHDSSLQDIQDRITQFLFDQMS